MRGVKRALVVVALGLGCADGPTSREEVLRESATRYLRDGAYRRAELVASLTTDANDYARLRIEKYERAWRDLPEWNPRVSVVRSFGTESSSGASAAIAVSEAARGGELEALRALGRDAFWRLPAMLLAPSVEVALHDRSVAEQSGLRGDDVVRVSLPGGGSALALTCASCHSATDRDGHLVAGLANARLDLGALTAEADATLAPEVVQRLHAWGPGRVDVSSDDGREPIAIPDLRPLRWQRYLQRAGAVRVRSLASVAVRVETLLITSLHEAARPPREVAVGLALYLDGLADEMAPVRHADARTESLFAARCGVCHSGEGYAGGMIEADIVGTDATLTRSTTRGTGSWRVPSLRGVAERARLMHDGSIAGLDALLDPRREGGHRAGLDLDARDRETLRGFLEGL
jgi:mono/diheme cytochrome c family protein